MAHPKKESALVRTLNSDDRKKPAVKKPVAAKAPESEESKEARAAAKALVQTLNSDDRTKHAKPRTFK